MARIMNDRRRVAKTPLSAVSGNGLMRVIPDTAPAFIAGVYCRRLLPAFIAGVYCPRLLPAFIARVY
jgi:hypothetical protein